ncbi:MAG: HEAT repeat domain-containing protein [Planctomycetota bacterium]
MSRAGRIGWLALLLSGLSACASTGPDRVALDQLPDAHRELLDAYREERDDWPSLRAAAAEDPALAAFLVDNFAASMVQSFQASRIGSLQAPDSPFRRAQNELVALGAHSTPLLVEMVASDDAILAHLGAETLVRIGDDAAASSLLLLDHPRPEVRRRGAELLGALPGPNGDELTLLAALARVAREDESWAVRAQAVRSMGARANFLPRTGALIQALSQATQDPDSTVAGEAARALGALGEVRAAPALIALVERAVAEADVKLHRAAQESLVELAGGGPQRDARAWRAWLEERLRSR